MKDHLSCCPSLFSLLVLDHRLNVHEQYNAVTHTYTANAILGCIIRSMRSKVGLWASSWNKWVFPIRSYVLDNRSWTLDPLIRQAHIQDHLTWNEHLHGFCVCSWRWHKMTGDWPSPHRIPALCIQEKTLAHLSGCTAFGIRRLFFITEYLYSNLMLVNFGTLCSWGTRPSWHLMIVRLVLESTCYIGY